MKPEDKASPAPKPAMKTPAENAVAFVAELKKLMDAHGPKGAALALVWPIAFFLTIIALAIIITTTGSLWPLCAFVLPLAGLFLFAGPRMPGKKE